MDALRNLQLTFGFRCKQSQRHINRRRFTQACLVNHGIEPKTLTLSYENREESYYIKYVKSLLSTMDDGRISISPYDTAWVALIQDLDGSDAPQFPSSLEWISRNQLSDGSWGDEGFFLVYDRLVNTLACVVALTFWNLHPHRIQKGISFIRENIGKLGEAKPEHMTYGFEIVFPALLQKAKQLCIEGIPYDHGVIHSIFAVRDEKMKRVPMHLLHEVPTCLLHNLEGLGSVESVGEFEWDRLLKLQTPKGSFLTSPAATAFAVMETKDEDCINYLSYIVHKFDGGAPTVYPVDIFARLWAVDRLQRLGISRFFKQETKKCLDHIYRFWRDKGVFSARESDFCDIDDTCMGFRLLRLHGYNVTPKPLMNFKNGEEFSCYVGQGFESPSPIFNLYRASQLMFPGETVLEQAKDFSHRFLKERLEANQLLDKWLISEHLPSEIKNGLEMPWYATLPRVETRLYIETYGVDDIWIGKSLFRMPEINEETYLKLAKLDFNKCQLQHLTEWDRIQDWYKDHDVEEYGVCKSQLLLDFFLATATIFEAERSVERLIWAKLQTLSNAIRSYYNSAADKEKCYSKLGGILVETLQELLNDHSGEWGRRKMIELCIDSWAEWVGRMGAGDDDEEQEFELIVRTVSLVGGHIVSEETWLHQEYKSISRIACNICSRLRKQHGNKDRIMSLIDEDMQHLVQLVFRHSSSDGISRNIKQMFFEFTRTYYYSAFFSTPKINTHVFKVLFENIV